MNPSLLKLFQLSLNGCLLALCGSLPAYAVDDLWHLHGFVSQGLIQAERSNFVNDTGNVSTGLTELGINGSYALSPDWRLSGQTMYLDGGNRYADGWRIDYLFLNWTAVNSLDWQLNLYAGRFKNMHWLFSSTRDVAVTRPMIVLPQSVYFDAFRDIAVGSDGLALQSTNSTSIGELEFVWSYGATPIGLEASQRVIAQQIQGNTTQKFVHQATLFFRPPESQTQWGLSLLDSDFSYRRAATDLFFDGDFTVQRVMASWRYSAEQWEVSSELMQERVKADGFYQPVFARNQFAQGAYLLGSYNWSNSTRLYASYDWFSANKDDRSGALLPIESGGLIPRYFGYQRDLGVGLTQELSKKMRVQLEYHWFTGTGRLGPNVVPAIEVNRSRHHELWAIQLMYWF
jgi:hypothetical protein